MTWIYVPISRMATSFSCESVFSGPWEEVCLMSQTFPNSLASALSPTVQHILICTYMHPFVAGQPFS